MTLPIHFHRHCWGNDIPQVISKALEAIPIPKADRFDDGINLDNVDISNMLDTAGTSAHVKSEVPLKLAGKLAYSMSKEYKNSSIVQSGNFIYPPNGGMGWHTNYKAPGLRVYLAHSDGISGMRFFVDGKIIDSPDKPGWNLREFFIDPEDPLWHCVYSETATRLSLGFRVIPNLKDY